MRKKLLFFCMTLLSALLLCAAVQAAGTTAVFVDNTSGVDTNSGITAAAPLKTLTKAYEKLRAAGGGTLVISGSVTIPASGFAPASTAGRITYTSVYGGTDYRKNGAALLIKGNFAASGATAFQNIDLHIYKSSAIFSGRHHDFTIGTGVNCVNKSTSSNFLFPCLVGGWNLPGSAAEANSSAAYTLSVASGTWQALNGGNRRAAASHTLGTLSGDRLIRITGGTFKGGTVSLTGDEYAAGRVVAEISGGTFADPVFLFRPLYNLPAGAKTAGAHTAQLVARISGGSFSERISTDGALPLENVVPNRGRVTLTVTGGSFGENVRFYNRGLLGSFVLRCSPAMESTEP